MMAFINDPVMKLATFVIIGFIISILTFTDNTETPLQTANQAEKSPNTLLLSSRLK